MKRNWRWIALATALLVCATAAVGISQAAQGEDGAIVDTALGPIRGKVDDHARRFRAVPYAAAPTGDLRWRSPKPAKPWTDVRDATKPAKKCKQNTTDGGPDKKSSEDCLYLEVTTPKKHPDKPRPVMVWMHGGGLHQGDGSTFDPTRMAERGDVVVVSINYRLGVFGYYGHPGLSGSGTFGLQDQQAALRWVKHNADAFGGDSGNVTLFGESAGGYATCGQLASPKSAGLFDKAILQSGTCSSQPWMISLAKPEPSPTKGTYWPNVDEVTANGKAAAKKLNCPGKPAKALACLRDLDAEKLLPIATAFASAASGTTTLPTDPATAMSTGAVPDIPLITGTTRDESRYLAAWAEYPDREIDPDRYIELTDKAFGGDADTVRKQYPLSDKEIPAVTWSALDTDRSMACPQLSDGRALSGGAPVYAYSFADRTAPPIGPFPPETAIPTGASHGSELEYLFATGVRDWEGNPIKLTAKQRKLSDAMIGYWTRFAHTGDPNNEGSPQWNPLGSGDSTAQSLATGPGGVKSTDAAAQHQCGFWDEFDGRS